MDNVETQKKTALSMIGGWFVFLVKEEKKNEYLLKFVVIEKMCDGLILNVKKKKKKKKKECCVK